jgi:hypothetical protein
MSNRANRRSKRRDKHLDELIGLYLQMQKVESEEPFQRLLAEHDRLTDADGRPRLVARTLEQFRQGPSVAG